MDIGEGMCYGECCEMCKPDDSQTCTLRQIIHYMLIKNIIDRNYRNIGEAAGFKFYIYLCASKLAPQLDTLA